MHSLHEPIKKPVFILQRTIWSNKKLLWNYFQWKKILHLVCSGDIISFWYSLQKENDVFSIATWGILHKCLDPFWEERRQNRIMCILMLERHLLKRVMKLPALTIFFHNAITLFAMQKIQQSSLTTIKFQHFIRHPIALN